MKNKSDKVGKWIPMELLNNWISFNAYKALSGLSPEYMDPGFMLDETGFVNVRGVLWNTTDRGEDICLMPPLYRPHMSAYGIALEGNTSLRCYIDNYVANKGAIRIPDGTASAGYVIIDTLRWWVGKERLRQL